MAAWLSANLINIVLVAVLLAVCALVIWGMVRQRRAGKPSCGGSCPGCSACAGCSACGGCCPQSGSAGSKAHS